MTYSKIWKKKKYLPTKKITKPYLQDEGEIVYKISKILGHLSNSLTSQKMFKEAKER
jgi:hypothetical protein